jgi:tartrate-resistant acid phosphatase type 5
MQTRSAALIVFLAWLSVAKAAVRLENDDCIRFLAIGDWGTPEVVRTAKAMAIGVHKPSAAGCKSRPASVLMLGDNFYESGITSPEDEKFKHYFVDNFQAPAFDNISFSVVAGNHGQSCPLAG